jgi:hypothetical protein
MNNLKNTENIYIPYPKERKVNITRMKTWWIKQSLPGYLMDKGGSFNVNLYLDYLEAINQQPIKYHK